MSAKKKTTKKLKGKKDMIPLKKSDGSEKVEKHNRNVSFNQESLDALLDIEKLLNYLPEESRQSESLKSYKRANISISTVFCVLLAGLELRKFDDLEDSKVQKIQFIRDKIKEIEEKILLPEEEIRKLYLE